MELWKPEDDTVNSLSFFSHVSDLRMKNTYKNPLPTNLSSFPKGPQKACYSETEKAKALGSNSFTAVAYYGGGAVWPWLLC